MHIYQIYMTCRYILLIRFLNEPKHILLHTIKWFIVLLCIIKKSIKHFSFVYTEMNDQTVIFHPGGDGNESVLSIPQISSITGGSPSNCLVSCPEYSLGGSYPSAEMQSVYSTAPASADGAPSSNPGRSSLHFI